MASWEFVWPELVALLILVGEPPTNWRASMKIKQSLILWELPFLCVPYFLAQLLSETERGYTGRRTDETRKQGENASVTYCSSSFLKKWQLSEIHSSWIRASFCSMLVTEGPYPQRILCNRKLQENLFSELSQWTLSNIFKVITYENIKNVSSSEISTGEKLAKSNMLVHT